jgi:hypothetical protein
MTGVAVKAAMAARVISFTLLSHVMRLGGNNGV